MTQETSAQATIFYSKLAHVRTLLRVAPAWASMVVLVVLVPLITSIWFIEQYDTVKYAGVSAGVLLATYFSFQQSKWVTTSVGKVAKIGMLLLGLFLAWSCIVSVFAIDPLYAFVGFYNRFANSFIFSLVFALTILIVSGFTTNQRRILIHAAFYAGSIAAVWSVMQSFGVGFSNNGVSAIARAPGFLGNPNFSAMYFALLMPFGWYVWYERGSSKFRTGAALMGSALLLLAIVLSGSRGAVLALCGAMLSAVVILQPFLQKRTILRASVVLCIGAVVVFSILNAVRPGIWVNTIGLVDTNSSHRVALWKVAVESIKERPLFGVGLGNALFVLERVQVPELAAARMYYDDVHNFFLQWAVTGGLPLAVVGLGMLLACAWAGTHFARHGNPQHAVALLSLVAWVIAALFTPVSVPNYFLLAILLGLLLGSGERSAEFFIPTWVRRGGCIVIGVGLVCIGSFLLGELYSGLGNRAYRMGDFARSQHLLGIGTRLNPTNPYAVFLYAGASVQNRAPQEVQAAAERALAQHHPKYLRNQVWRLHIDAMQYFSQPTPQAARRLEVELQEIIDADPTAPHYRYLLAQWYMLTQQYVKAREQAEIATKFTSHPYQELLLIAKAYQQENNYDQFVVYLAKAVDVATDERAATALMLARGSRSVQVPLEIYNILGAI